MEEAAQSAPAAVQTGQCVHYERRRPEATSLYQLVQEHAETGVGLPDFVKTSLKPFYPAIPRRHTHLVLSPLEFMQRLAAPVPRPRLNLISFHV